MAVLITDLYSPAWSLLRNRVAGISQLSADIPSAIQTFNDVLVSVGWTSIPLVSGGQLLFTLFFGTEFEPLIMDGHHYHRPGGYITLGALATDISFNSQWNATAGFSGGLQTIFLTAKVGGPIPNQPTVFILPSINPYTDGSYLPGASFGGGYQLTSKPNPTTGDQIVVNITEDDTGFLSFLFGAANYQLTAGFDMPRFIYTKIPKYTIIACSYQFLIVDEANTVDSYGGFAGGNSIFATTPYIDPLKMPTLVSCIVIIGPGNLKSSMIWDSSPCTVSINGTTTSFTPGFAIVDTCGVTSCNYPFSDALLNLDQRPLIQNAYLVVPPLVSVESAVVGKIWDGVVFSETGSAYPNGFEVTNNGIIFHNVSNQDAAVNSSFWLRAV